MLRAFAFFVGFAVLTSPVWADIIVLKDGNIMEVKFVEMQKKDKKDILVFENEKKDKVKLVQKDIKGWFKKKPSWEVRAENQIWYTKENEKIRATWEQEFKFAQECRKRNLDDAAGEHFQKAYEIRKPAIKDEESDHKKISDWLEKDCELFDESLAEMRAVFEYKKKKIQDTVDGHMNLARFAEAEGLMTEAQAEYEGALKVDPKNTSARNAREKLLRSLEFPLDAGFYRGVRGPMRMAAKYLRTCQNPDGTFGWDPSYYGVHGHRAITSLALIALICAWEFDVLEKGEAAREVPKEISSALEIILSGEHRKGTQLQGLDIWGPIFEVDLLARCSRKKMLERYHERIRKRMTGALKDLIEVRKKEGGWMYYDFASSASFPTAAAIFSLLNAKNSGFEVNQADIDLACTVLGKLKFAEGSYNYEGAIGNGMHPSNSPVGASARSPVSEGALVACGRGTEQSLNMAVEYFFRWRPVLQAIKGEGGTHIGKGMVAPYYFLFGHYWTTRVVKLMDRPMQRRYLATMRAAMVSYQEPSDYSFWDWKGEKGDDDVAVKPFYQTYGTALAMMTLYHIASIEKDPALGQQKIENPNKLTPPKGEETPTGDGKKREDEKKDDEKKDEDK